MKELSIIIVAYKAKRTLERCLASIPKNKQYEVIVIDNTYDNKGFSKACNLGASQAIGKYLFFLNPDAQLQPDTTQKLLQKIKQNPELGIIAPQFLNAQHVPYLSYSKQPTFFTFPIRFSFIEKFLPRKIICALHSYECDTLSEEKYVEAVSGAGLLIEKKLFEKIGGFDEDFFMYWEDYVICQKVSEQNRKILYYPTAQLVHLGAGTTINKKVAKEYFQKSRFIYLRKKFGLLYAMLVEGFLRLSEAL